MAQIILNSAVTMLIAAAFLITVAAPGGGEKAAQKVPVKARRQPRSDS